MANTIARDAVTTSSTQTSSPITWNHTCTGGDLYLVVCISLRSTGSSTPTFTSASYNGVAMTQANTTNTAGSGNRMAVAIYTLANPATGTNQVSVSCANITAATGTSISYTGAQQVTAVDSSAVSSATTTGAKTLATTTVADNAWTVSVWDAGSGASNPTWTSPTQTEQANVTNGTGGQHAVEDSNGPKTPAGSVTHGYTVGGTTVRSCFVNVSFGPTTSKIVNVNDSSAATENVDPEANMDVHRSSDFYQDATGVHIV